MNVEVASKKPSPFAASSPWVDLGLTLPMFVGYHLGVAFLPMRNAADWVTLELVELADHNILGYAGLTLGIGAVYVGLLAFAGRGESLRWDRFLLIAVEGMLYALAMRLAASYVVGRMALQSAAAGDAIQPSSAASVEGAFPSVVMSLGAGFYEEIAFRVVLFGLGVRFIQILFSLEGLVKALVPLVWAAVAAALFSGWHYVGALGEVFELRSFAFRWVCGCIFTLIYVFRGFAPAVWTHALYDVWVLAF